MEGEGPVALTPPTQPGSFNISQAVCERATCSTCKGDLRNGSLTTSAAQNGSPKKEVLTAAAPQKTSRSRGVSWDPSAAPPLGSCCPPGCCGSACSIVTGPLCPLAGGRDKRSKGTNTSFSFFARVKKTLWEVCRI